MGITYYCDLDLAFSNAVNVGDAAGTPAGGPGGLLAMIHGWGNHDQLAAGDTLWCQDAADLQKLIKITVDVDKSGTWVIGDNVQNNNDGGGAAGDNWDGALVFIDATTLWVQLDTSGDIDDVDTADGVHNVTQTDNILAANMTAAAAPGVTFLAGANDGDAANGRIWLRGTTNLADPTNNIGQFTLDADLDAGGAATAATNCIKFDSATDWWRVSNMTVMGAGGDNIDGAACDGWYFEQCIIKEATTDGTSNRLFYDTMFETCVFRDNGGRACDDTGVSCFFLFCRVHDNSVHGIDARYTGAFVGSIFYDNTGNGIDAIDTIPLRLILHCVFDKEAGQVDGYEGATDQNTYLFGNRFLHHTGSAIVGGPSTIEDWNVFHGNAANRTGVTAGANSIVDDVNDGVTDAANHDYNVTDDADIDNEPIDLNWD